MDTILDQPERLYAGDGGGMLRVLSRFPESCSDAIEAAGKLSLGAISSNVLKNVVIAGVGGSAIGGLLLRDWLMDDYPIPIHVSRDYGLPRFVDEDSLLIAVSYSGNTEETLSALRGALDRRCKVITITSGGAMQKISAENGTPTLMLPSGMQPRASLPNQFFSLATIINRLGLPEVPWAEVEESIGIVKDLRSSLVPETPISSNPSKQIAMGLSGMVPFVYGPKLFEGVSYRICTQLNENAKVPSGSGFFPEAFHNVVMSREGPEEMLKRICIMMITDSEESGEMRRKMEAFRSLMEPNVGRILEIHARGHGKLGRIMSALYIGDYASAYLGLLYGLDPSSTGSIEALKKAK